MTSNGRLVARPNGEGTVEGQPVAAAPDDLSDVFRTRLRELVREVDGGVPLARMSSADECGLCDIGGGNCPDRMEWGVDPPELEHDLCDRLVESNDIRSAR